MVIARIRRGSSKLGCLLTLLLVVAGAYFAFNLGEVFYRSYRYEDMIKQQVRFAQHYTDDQIRTRLRAGADSLGLPEDVSVRIRRSANRISVSAEWEEHVELPLFVRTFRFTPAVSGPL